MNHPTLEMSPFIYLKLLLYVAGAVLVSFVVFQILDASRSDESLKPEQYSVSELLYEASSKRQQVYGDMLADLEP